MGKGKPFKKGNIPWNKGKKYPHLNNRLGKKHSKESRQLMSKNHMDISGSKNPNWKGGRIKDASGYILIYSPNHPFKSKHNLVLEHRLVMEKYLGRFLRPEEVVHHLNGIVDDNRIENLQLFIANGEHLKLHLSKV